MLSTKQNKLMAVLTKRGFIFPSFEIYGGVSGFYDYGDLGTKLKRKVQNIWYNLFVAEENAFEIDTRTILPKPVLQASGHLEKFTDPVVQCQKCRGVFRADHIIQDKLGIIVEGFPAEELDKIIKKNDLRCPKCSSHLSKVTEFNLLFKTFIGPEQKEREAFLRPETCQGHFLLFKRLFQLNGNKLPLFVAQIGRSYRNEISPRGGLIRLREFDQMELEIFVDPEKKTHPNFKKYEKVKLKVKPLDSEEKEVTCKESVEGGIVSHELMGYSLAKSKVFFREIGVPEKHIRFIELSKDERPFYALETWDTQIWSETFGWVEVTANNDRGAHDLESHMRGSGEKLTVRNEEGEEFIPHVIEMSYGLDRPIYCLLESVFVENDGRNWSYLKLNGKVAPIEVAVLPVVNKEEMVKKSLGIYNKLRKKFNVKHLTGYVGKNYAKMDEIGVLYCVTVDGETFKNNTVTIRDRDSRKQVRVGVDELNQILEDLVSGKKNFEEL